MKVNLNEAKAWNIRFAYLCFIGLSIVSLVLTQFQIGQDFVRFGTIGNSISFGAYVFIIFLNLKLLFKNKLLFVGNICFICVKLTFVTLALYFEFRGLRELILVVLATILFILISKRTLQILLKLYNPELSLTV
jgi:hypothetical protein